MSTILNRIYTTRKMTIKCGHFTCNFRSMRELMSRSLENCLHKIMADSKFSRPLIGAKIKQQQQQQTKKIKNKHSHRNTSQPAGSCVPHRSGRRCCNILYRHRNGKVLCNAACTFSMDHFVRRWLWASATYTFLRRRHVLHGMLRALEWIK